MSVTTKTKTSAPEAVPGAEVLAAYGQLADALHETSASIPADLAEEARLYADLGAAEVADDDVTQLRSKLDAVRARRETAVRRRAAASDGLAKMEGELLAARRAADEARGRLAGEAVRQLQDEWTQTVERLAEIHGRVQAFQQVMHTQVRLAAPYKAVADLMTGQPALQFTAAAASAPAALPPSLQGLTDLIGKLDIAGGLASAIRQAREADQRHYRLCAERRMNASMPAMYTVTKPIGFLGASFEPGCLVDSSLINVGTLHRFLSGRYITEAASQPAAAA
jgi:hypothetical protein